MTDEELVREPFVKEIVDRLVECTGDRARWLRNMVVYEVPDGCVSGGKLEEKSK